MQYQSGGCPSYNMPDIIPIDVGYSWSDCEFSIARQVVESTRRTLHRDLVDCRKASRGYCIRKVRAKGTGREGCAIQTLSRWFVIYVRWLDAHVASHRSSGVAFACILQQITFVSCDARRACSFDFVRNHEYYATDLTCVTRYSARQSCFTITRDDVKSRASERAWISPCEELLASKELWAR